MILESAKKVSEVDQLKERLRELENKNSELNRMYSKESEEKLRIAEEIAIEKNQWNCDRATLLDLNLKLSRMLEQVNNKINSLKKGSE